MRKAAGIFLIVVGLYFVTHPKDFRLGTFGLGRFDAASLRLHPITVSESVFYKWLGPGEVWTLKTAYTIDVGKGDQFLASGISLRPPEQIRFYHDRVTDTTKFTVRCGSRHWEFDSLPKGRIWVIKATECGKSGGQLYFKAPIESVLLHAEVMKR